MGDLLAHTYRLEARLERLWPEQVYAFDLACVERQWPIYARAAAGCPWDRTASLRRGIDQLWGWLPGAAALPHGVAAVCADAIFSDTTGAARPDLRYEPVNDAETAALFFVIDLAELTENIVDERPEDCVTWARRTLHVVDSAIQDSGAPPGLERAAIAQQEADLAAVTRTGDAASVVAELRAQASRDSVLSGWWFAG